jgi:cell wall-associated NlpC family hydrolase
MITISGLGDDFVSRDALNPSTIDTSHWYNMSSPYYINEPSEIKWGPCPRQYVAESGAPHSTEWQRQRIIYVAKRYIGNHYQHHHIIQWDPPQTWPFNPVSLGHQSKGIDCSDFSSWVYNYGLGIRLNSAVADQAKLDSVPNPGGIGKKPVQKIIFDTSFANIVSVLNMGDLLYILPNADSTNASHVIIWIGKPSNCPDYLVIDSHDQTIKDMNNKNIPTGVRIRPFRQSGWYHRCLRNVNRIIY